ncbi:MAG: class I SAM-dependent methyltransferase [Candidatus Hermodarchaeota archaeon]
MNNDKYFETNLKRWNELVDINVKSRSYDLDGFKSGKTSLLPIELKELGDVSGKSLLHLQCHFGMDTLSWARLGAKVTGVDFSDKAIDLAKALSKELSIPVRFINANIYDIPNILDEEFDVVFTSYGTICWLPDLEKWAEIISNCLKPGGIFYIIDGHPFGFIIDENQEPFKVGFNYFSEGKPVFFEGEGAYADPSAKLKNPACYEWDHPMSEIINSLLKAKLEIEFLHEFPYTFFSIHPDMKKKEDGYWEFKNFSFTVPMMFSIKSHKKF